LLSLAVVAPSCPFDRSRPNGESFFSPFFQFTRIVRPLTHSRSDFFAVPHLSNGCVCFGSFGFWSPLPFPSPPVGGFVCIASGDGLLAPGTSPFGCYPGSFFFLLSPQVVSFPNGLYGVSPLCIYLFGDTTTDLFYGPWYSFEFFPCPPPPHPFRGSGRFFSPAHPSFTYRT